MKKYFKFYTLIFIAFFTLNTYSQDVYGGIEIGGKGVKVSIIKIIDIQVGEFELVKTWTRNTNITKNIDKDGNLLKIDIDDTSYVVLDLIIQIKREFKINENNIFLVGSSSVAIAPNKQELADKVKALCKKNLDFLTPEVESKLIIKGAIPQRDYLNSVILDIGSGSIKGGVIELDKNRTYAFSPFGAKYGTTKLTEKVKAKVGNSTAENAYLNEMIKYQDTVSATVKSMFDKVPTAKTKDNVYVLGGAAWIFATLTKPDEKDAYHAFSHKEFIDYTNNITKNYDEFIKKEYVNKDYERVIKSFNKEAIISSCMLMNQLIANLDKPAQKKYYFVRQGQVAWLIAYIVDIARDNKPAN